MPPPIESEFFRQQRPCCAALEKFIVPVIADITGAKGKTVNVPMNIQNSCHTKAQTKDIAAPKAKVIARALGTTEWFLYHCPSKTAGTEMLIMVGKPLNTGNVYPFFDWILSPEDTTALNGDWDPGDLTNDVDMACVLPLKYSHDDKHFNANLKSEAQYTIGSLQRRKNIVAGMEEMAVEHGFGSGERFFKFSTVVGKDPLNNTNCIRVDTPGGPSQHSHPIPETGIGEVTHDSKIVKFICYHTRERQLDGLVEIAKYLTLIKEKKKAYPNLKKFEHLCGGARPPPCAYWSW
jgi:hypothetical protein